MMIYDIEKKYEPEYLELTDKESPSGVLVVNGEQDMVIFEHFEAGDCGLDTEYCLFNSRKKITLKQIAEEDHIVAVSYDKKSFVEIKANYSFSPYDGGQ